MKLTLLLAGLLTLSLSGCGAPDAPICRGLKTKPETKMVEGIGQIVLQRPNPKCMKMIGEPVCGFCQWTTSDKTQYVGENPKYHLELKGKKKPWSQVANESYLTPAESYADFKKFTIDSCKRLSNCDKAIPRWRVKFDSFDSLGDGFK